MTVEIIVRIIYLFLCGFAGFVCSKADMSMKDWKTWAIIFSLIGAYTCGYLRGCINV